MGVTFAPYLPLPLPGSVLGAPGAESGGSGGLVRKVAQLPVRRFRRTCGKYDAEFNQRRNGAS